MVSRLLDVHPDVSDPDAPIPYALTDAGAAATDRAAPEGAAAHRTWWNRRTFAVAPHPLAHWMFHICNNCQGDAGDHSENHCECARPGARRCNRFQAVQP